jgi:hypothetical protein
MMPLFLKHGVMEKKMYIMIYPTRHYMEAIIYCITHTLHKLTIKKEQDNYTGFVQVKDSLKSKATWHLKIIY